MGSENMKNGDLMVENYRAEFIQQKAVPPTIFRCLLAVVIIFQCVRFQNFINTTLRATGAEEAAK
jgi:hypothetical protein